MTTYTWPTSRHFVPATHELRVVDNTQRTVESSLSGYVQTNAMPGARWGWGMDFTAHTQAQRAEVEGYLLRLSGRQHRVQLWDLRNPGPRGNISTMGVTLGAAAAQFATSLTLAGCRPANYALLAGGFETDADGDGVGDGWTRYSFGSAGVLTALLDPSDPLEGVRRQYLSASALGSGASDRHGVQRVVAVDHLAGRSIAAGTNFGASISTSVAVAVTFNAAGGAHISGADLYATAVATGSGYQAVFAVGMCPSNAVSAIVTLYQHSGAGVLAEVIFDAARLGVGDSLLPIPQPATLLAGDWLGLTGGQLVRVVADATANDAGAMTVEVRHMLRAAVSSGTAVTLDKPTALYVRTEAGLALPRMPGNVDPGLSLDLVEVFA